MSNMISKNKEVNPFLTVMMFNMSFRAWKRLSRKANRVNACRREQEHLWRSQ